MYSFSSEAMLGGCNPTAEGDVALRKLIDAGREKKSVSVLLSPMLV